MNLPVESARPTRRGSRRRPPAREIEQKRPGSIYRTALEISLAKMMVIDRIREERVTAVR
jgi:hypothetical protein